MPSYDFKCLQCETTFPVLCSISSRTEPKECPNCKCMETQQVILGAPSMGDSVRLGLQKPSQEFRQLMKSIKDRNPGAQFEV